MQIELITFIQFHFPPSARYQPTFKLLEHVQRTRKSLNASITLATLEDQGVIGPVAIAGNTLDSMTALLRTLPFIAPLVDGGRRRFAHLPAEPGSLQDLRDIALLLTFDGGYKEQT